MCLDKKYYINQFCDALYISARYIAMNKYYYIGQPMYISYIKDIIAHTDQILY